ncbi:hypothetical protein EDC01DRAFT_72015 [Geopyxis carbonaria]|nr:hypothetical protein EDC01DRAFT_72015 [Geopyxis carbonaria]
MVASTCLFVKTKLKLLWGHSIFQLVTNKQLTGVITSPKRHFGSNPHLLADMPRTEIDIGAPSKASVNNVYLDGTKVGRFGFPGITPETARATSECLNDNHKKHHIFFNESGFHNHIVHNLLAQYDFGSPSNFIRETYKRETSYQRPIDVGKKPADIDLSDKSTWSKYLGDQAAYAPFLVYFKDRIEKIGWRETVSETLFSGTALADDLLVRLYGGFLHPFIHLGYGIEFEQPAIVAEGLAMMASHENWIGELFFRTEEAVKETKEDTSSVTLVSLLHSIRKNEKLRMTPEWNDGNKVKSILQRASQEIISVVKQYKVPLSQVEIDKKVAENINSSALFTGASQRKDKEIRIDFYYMHCINSSIFLSAYMNQSWIPIESKARILEWKGWLDLAMYASRRAPELLVDDIRKYVPKAKDLSNPWLNIIDRGLKIKDDGHAIKLIRALANGERLCRGYQNHEDQGFVMKGDMWIKMAHMCMDSVETPGTMWARSVGFDEAWEDYGPRKKY